MMTEQNGKAVLTRGPPHPFAVLKASLSLLLGRSVCARTAAAVVGVEAPAVVLEGSKWKVVRIGRVLFVLLIQ